MATSDFSGIQNTKLTPRELLTSPQAARYLGVNRQWLAQARMRGESPVFIKYGKSQNSPIRYDKSDLDAWLNDHKFESTSQATDCAS